MFHADRERFEEHHTNAANLFPTLAKTEISKIINGPVSFTPDGNPIIGWSPDIENMFVCTGFTAGIGCAGGVGSFASEWITEGRFSKAPTHDKVEENDLKNFSPNRFHGMQIKEATKLATHAYGSYYNLLKH